MFKVIIHFDDYLGMGTRASYAEALALFTAWNEDARKLQIAGIINEYYVELVREAVK